MHLDWAGLLKIALMHAKLKPDEFWALTPIEFRLMIGDDPDLAPLGRAQLDALMSAYPDNDTTMQEALE